MSTYTNYYTCSDTFVFIQSGNPSYGSEPVLLDKLGHIGYSESTSARPIYGIGNPIHGFTNIGNITVVGDIALRFVHEDYMLNAVKSAIGNSISGGITPKEFKNSTAQQVNKKKRDSVSLSRLNSSSLFDIPRRFDIRIHFNNGNIHHQDSGKNILIKDCRILSSELMAGVDGSGPINIKYRFIAKSVKGKNEERINN